MGRGRSHCLLLLLRRLATGGHRRPYSSLSQPLRSLPQHRSSGRTAHSVRPLCCGGPTGWLALELGRRWLLSFVLSQPGTAQRLGGVGWG